MAILPDSFEYCNGILIPIIQESEPVRIKQVPTIYSGDWNKALNSLRCQVKIQQNKKPRRNKRGR